MLCLSRRKGERIMIGDDIQVVLLEIRGDKCRLGIISPDNVPIMREELLPVIDKPLNDMLGGGTKPFSV